VIVKPGILPLAPPPAAALAPAVEVVHVAQTNVSAWAVGIEAAAQEANISADTGLVKRFLKVMIKLLKFENFDGGEPHSQRSEKKCGHRVENAARLVFLFQLSGGPRGWRFTYSPGFGRRQFGLRKNNLTAGASPLRLGFGVLRGMNLRHSQNGNASK
jgi:hypothetical protein